MCIRDRYLPDGQEEFQTAYAAAKALDQNATQSAIDEAAQALVKAMLNLRKIPSREELKAYIAEMERVDLDAYTASSAATFRSALAAAKAVAADEEADGQMLATAFYQLQDAEQGLEKACLLYTSSAFVSSACSSTMLPLISRIWTHLQLESRIILNRRAMCGL